MKKTYHICQDVRGAIKNWTKQQWADVARDNGISVDRCKEWFRIQEFNGVKVIPIGPRCEGFSDIDGCPGHEVDDEKVKMKTIPHGEEEIAG